MGRDMRCTSLSLSCEVCHACSYLGYGLLQRSKTASLFCSLHVPCYIASCRIQAKFESFSNRLCIGEVVEGR
jgi:hypothetical protein